MTEKKGFDCRRHLPKAGPRIKAVLFDFDGTLTLPGALDFPEIKRSIGCPPEMAILEYIDSIREEDLKEQVIRKLDLAEETAARKSIPNDGAEELLLWLKKKDIRIGVITRNAVAPVMRALENFDHFSLTDFDVVVSREDPVEPKPSPEGIELALKRLNTDCSEALMVGDFLFDITAGNNAGASTILIPAAGEKRDVSGWGQDFQIARLEELKEIISCYLPLKGGKLPNRFLEHFLTDLPIEDPSVIVSPGVGEDTTAVDISGEEVLILKSDPITFVSESAARYAVTINANDIATSGGTPRWFLSTLLFPPDTTPCEILLVMSELQEFCRRQQITLCGGHTEISDAVTRPVISGMVAGTVSRNRLVDKRQMAAGDCILLTKAVSIEGTAILAREFSVRLTENGCSRTDISEGSQLLDQISISAEAAIAAACDGVTAMHDVTEGGLATALAEFARAGNCRLRIDMDRIPVMELTRRMCRILDLDPLGLIGSGSLLIACREQSLQSLLDHFENASIQATVIGKILADGVGIDAHHSGEATPWPAFETDELTRLFG